MSIDELIAPQSVLCNAEARSKKHCLEILSELLSGVAPDVPNEEIFWKLVERERLGCTGLGRGTAFPHCRIEGLAESAAALVKLSSPIDFDTDDGQTVDLVVALMVPAAIEESHYNDLNLVKTMLEDQTLRRALRASTTSKQLYTALLDAQALANQTVVQTDDAAANDVASDAAEEKQADAPGAEPADIVAGDVAE